MPAFRDLVTVLYSPRETMRRVLDATDRWAPQVVTLAFVCASVNDSEVEALTSFLPTLTLWSGIAVIVFGTIAGALLWVAALYVLGWIAWYAGRKMEGAANAADVRAALAWAIVPIIWSIVYRVPFGILHRNLGVRPAPNVTSLLIDFASKGGCSLVVVYLALQLAFMVWCVWIASNTVAEAQQFTTGKGFLNVAITLAVPVAVIAAVVIARH